MIFRVEDDQNIQRLELYTLRSAGFEATGFTDGENLFTALRADRPELVILDGSMIETVRNAGYRPEVKP